MRLLGVRGRWLLVPALLMGGVGASWAYKISGTFWNDAQTTFFSGIPGQSPGGRAWADEFRGAMNRWNELTPFQFDSDPTYSDPCIGHGRNTSGNGRNGAGFRGDVCGNAFDRGTLAITLSLFNQLDHLIETDIIFNSTYSWDIYEGPPRNAVDFHRVALHELGHALGLGHELTKDALMQPQVGLLSDLTADDIAGANAIYASGGGQTCRTAALDSNARVNDVLSAGNDCRMRELFNNTDESFVDVYRVELATEQRLYLHAKASGFKPVLVALTPGLDVIEIFEGDDTCEVQGVTALLPPDSYYILVNTYDQPTACGAGQGEYEFSVSDSPLPVLGPPRTFGPAAAPQGILFQAGASKDGGQSYASHFAASDSVDVSARIKFAPNHVRQQGAIYMVAILDDGRSFMKTMNGNFVPFSGRQSDLQPVSRLPLGNAPVGFDVVKGLRGDLTGLAGHDFHVFIGYSVASAPGVVYYPSAPLSFRIAAP